MGRLVQGARRPDPHPDPPPAGHRGAADERPARSSTRWTSASRPSRTTCRSSARRASCTSNGPATQSWWRINDRCLACFPSAAELIMGRLPLVAPWDDTGDACAHRDLLMTATHGSGPRPLRRRGPPGRRRRAASAPPSGSPFGAGHYDDARRPAGRRGAGQPRVRQPGRRRRPPAGRDRAGPRLRRRHRRAAVGPPGRTDRVRLRARRHRRDARPRPPQRRRGRRRQRRVPPRHHRARPARATPRSTSSSPTASSCCPATRTPRSPRSPGCCAPAAGSGSATSSAPAPTTAPRPAVDCAAGAITVDAYERRAAPRRARPRRRSSSPTRSAAGCPTPSSAPPSQPSRVRPMRADDWPAVRDDLRGRDRHRQRHLRDQRAPTWERWDASHLADHRLVATDVDGRVVGWAALSPVSDRCVVRRGRREQRLHPPRPPRPTASAPICSTPSSPAPSTPATGRSRPASSPRTPPASPLHERVGFRIVGRRERIGQLDGAWRDTSCSNVAATTCDMAQREHAAYLAAERWSRRELLREQLRFAVPSRVRPPEVGGDQHTHHGRPGAPQRGETVRVEQRQ